MTSEFLKKFHQERFSNNDVEIYSKEMFHELLEELNKKSEKMKD